MCNNLKILFLKKIPNFEPIGKPFVNKGLLEPTHGIRDSDLMNLSRSLWSRKMLL